MSNKRRQDIEEMMQESEEKERITEQSDENSAGDNTSESLDNLIEDQQARINELEDEIRQLKETHLRKAAELENSRKRLQREREQVFQASREAAVEAFLPVNDDLIRILTALEDAGADLSFLDGIKLVAEKFEDVLKRHGVERIAETGVPFDVNLHDAMLRQKPEDTSIESGTVLQVIENGYRIGDKTIRHAKVIVSE